MTPDHPQWKDFCQKLGNFECGELRFLKARDLWFSQVHSVIANMIVSSRLTARPRRRIRFPDHSFQGFLSEPPTTRSKKKAAARRPPPVGHRLFRGLRGLFRRKQNDFSVHWQSHEIEIKAVPGFRRPGGSDLGEEGFPVRALSDYEGFKCWFVIAHIFFCSSGNHCWIYGRTVDREAGGATR
jgi:hypothetical protein